MSEHESTTFVDGVRQLIVRKLRNMDETVRDAVDVYLLMPGKMLRTRMAARLHAALPGLVPDTTLMQACTAVEMVHTASLCHDDVIDGAVMRRGRPSLWQSSSVSGAVLVGDMLLCDAVGVLVEVEGGRYIVPLIEKIRQVCTAEAQQELVYRGKALDRETCLRIARRKTGPLFAFLGQLCGGTREALAEALEQACYNIGTAYQLADDVLDITGSEDVAGKTLRTDLTRGKFTLSQDGPDGPAATYQDVENLLHAGVELLAPWPQAHTALLDFSGALVRGWLTERQVFRAATLFLGIGVLSGMVLVYLVGWVVLLLGVLGTGIVLAYTRPGLCLKYAGLGDVAIFIAFGFLPVFGTYWVQSREFSWLPVLWTLPLASLTVAILHANNWRDIAVDRTKDCRTFAAALGARGSAVYYRILVLAPFVLTAAYFVAAQLPHGRQPAPPTVFLVLLVLPLAIRLARIDRERNPAAFSRLDAKTAQLQLLFGGLLAVAFFCARYLPGQEPVGL